MSNPDFNSCLASIPAQITCPAGAAMAASQEGLIVAGPDGIAIAVNESARQMLPGVEEGVSLALSVSPFDGSLASALAERRTAQGELKCPYADRWLSWRTVVEGDLSVIALTDVTRLRDALQTAAAAKRSMSMLVLEKQLLQADVERARDMFERHSGVDGETQVANSVALRDRLLLEVGRSRRYQTALSLILVEADAWKNAEGSAGTGRAGEMIRNLADLLTGRARTTDFVARLSAGTFALILPETRGNDALLVAERVRAQVLASAAECDTTVSCGVASMHPGVTDADALLEHAKTALDVSRKLGHDCVTHYAALSDPSSVASGVLL